MIPVSMSSPLVNQEDELVINDDIDNLPQV